MRGWMLSSGKCMQIEEVRIQGVVMPAISSGTPTKANISTWIDLFSAINTGVGVQAPPYLRTLPA